MKKILCVSLAVIMLVLSVTACSDKGDISTDTDTIDVLGLEIVKDQKSHALIVYPKGNVYLNSVAQNLVSKIYDKTGVWVDAKREDAVESDPNRIEILIGNVDRPESIAARQKLKRAGDYLYEVSGNKLVITGYSDLATKSAVTHFISNNIIITKNKNIIFTADKNFFYEKNYTVNISQCAGNDLADYKIVYPKVNLNGEYFVALSLRYHIFDKVGYDLPVVPDSTATEGNEILVGATNRGITPTVEHKKFSVAVKDGNLCISANDLFGYVAAEKYLTDTLFSKSSQDGTITADFSYVADVTDNGDRHGDYRVIFHNCWGLGESSGKEYHYANRDEYTAAYYLAYRPDVIALNEFWDMYRNQKTLLNALTNNGYVEVIAPSTTESAGATGDPKSNVLPIFYNPERLKLIESQYTHYNWYESGVTAESVENGTAKMVMADDSKGVTIAVFAALDENGNENGERFIICNTHFTSNMMSSIHGTLSRMHDIEVAWTQLQPFVNKYTDASVLMGCDYNCTVSSKEIKQLFDYGFKDCHKTADVADNQASYHDAPHYNDYLGYFVSGTANNSGYDSAIDHVFEYGDTVDVKFFDIASTEYTSLMSDHAPIIVDFNVIKETT